MSRTRLGINCYGSWLEAVGTTATLTSKEGVWTLSVVPTDKTPALQASGEDLAEVFTQVIIAWGATRHAGNAPHEDREKIEGPTWT